MQTAAQQASYTELNQCRFDSIAHARQPRAATGAAYDIRFLHNLAQSAEVRERICGGGGGEHDPARPIHARRASSAKRRRSVPLLKQAQKPIGRRPGEQPAAAGLNQVRRHHRLQAVDADDDAECRHLQPAKTRAKTLAVEATVRRLLVERARSSRRTLRPGT